MKVPLLDLSAQLQPLREEILKVLAEVLDSTRYILGPRVEAFERQIAEYVGVSHAVGVSSGTDALLIALMVHGIGPGDRVVTTPFSFFATAGVIARVGATPLFADIEPRSFNLDAEALYTIGNRKDIKAVIPVHLFGQCSNMGPILETARRRKWVVVEDAAQALGACYPGPEGIRRAGAMGQAGAFSFFPSKNLGGIGDSGMVVTNDTDTYEKLLLFRNHGARLKYHHEFIGGNFRMDPVQAAVLSVKLRFLDQWHATRRANADLYDRLFMQSGMVEKEWVRLPERMYTRNGEGMGHIFNQYVLRVAQGRRDALKAFLAESGVGTEIYYPVPFHLQPCFRHLGFREGAFPVAEQAAREVLALPVYPGLSPDMQAYVVERIEAFFRREGGGGPYVSAGD